MAGADVLVSVGLDRLTLIFCALVVFAGSYLKGYTGFGASMLWATGLSLVLPPRDVIPMILMFEVVSSVYMLPQVWKDVQWRSIATLLMGTWIATPVGIYALSHLDAAPIRLGLAIAVFIAAILILRGFALTREPSTPSTFGIGMAAGALNGSMGIVGPPAILFYFSSPIGVVAGHASIVAYFIGTDAVGTVMFAAQDLIGANVYWRTVLFLPLLFLGVAVGSRGFIKTDPDTFKKVALFVLLGLSVSLFARALWH